MKLLFFTKKVIPSNKENHSDWHNGLSPETDKSCIALQGFLDSDIHFVAELKGEWGVGKTHFWHSFLGWVISNRTLNRSLRAHSYVSLFGATSIDSIESAIFTSHQPIEYKKASWIVKAGKWIKRLLDRPESSTIQVGATSIAIGAATSIIDSLIKRHYIHNFLICFDDIERMERVISPSSFLGLISTLKEQQNCKIVLIYNFEKLASNARLRMAMEEYREKIIDVEISLRPSVSENIKIAWPESEQRPSSFVQIFEAADVVNIRVMRKARSAIDYFKGALAEQWPFAHESFQAAIAALAIIHYSKTELFPEYEGILVDDFFKLLAAKEPLQMQQEQFMRNTGYYPAPHHRMILDYFRNGVIDLKSYSGLLRLTESNEKLARFNGQYDLILRNFNRGFFVPHQELVFELHQFLIKHSREIGIDRANSATDFLRKCGLDIGDEYVINAINSHVKREDVLDEYSLWFSDLPDRFRKELIDRYEAIGKRQKIAPLMQRLAGRYKWDPGDGWNSDDLKLLREKTQDEWLDWISTYDAEKETEETGDFCSGIFHLVGTFLNRFKNTPEGADQETLRRITSALEILRLRSEVDRLRVEMLYNYMQENC